MLIVASVAERPSVGEFPSRRIIAEWHVIFTFALLPADIFPLRVSADIFLSTKMIHKTRLRSATLLLLFYFFSPLLDIDRRCGAHIRLQSFPQHHLEIKGNRADMWWAELLCALDGLNHILQWSNHSQKKKLQVKGPTRQDKLSLSNARRSHGKTKAISYWCHHPVQSGWNSISLSLHIYIYRKAVQQSSVASISRHVQLWSEQQSWSGLQRRWLSILLFPLAGWDDTLKKKKKNFNRTI